MDTRIIVLDAKISLEEVKKENLEKNALFYMANLYPEIGRMFSFLDSGKLEASQNAQKRSKEIIPAGREEWNVIKNFILGYDKLDTFERSILERYAEPFSYKFMNHYTAGI
jgi:hypothetical protein